MAQRSISELDAWLRQQENLIKKNLIDVAQVMALNFKAYADSRIKNNGIPGERYSENDLPVNWLMGSAKTEYGKQAIKKLAKERAKNGEGVDYTDLRQAENLQTEYVDLTFSGAMLRGWGITEVKEIGPRFVALLGGTNEDSKRKLAWQKSRYGNFWVRVVGDDGIKLLKQILEKELNRVKKDNGL